jgi:neutral ceramidase
METATMPHHWRAGLARATFPVPPGTPLGGYIAREHPASGTLDPLQIAVLILDDGERQIALIGADMVAVDASLVRQIAGRSGIPEDQVLLGASHTHAAPRGIVERLHPSYAPTADEVVRERFVAASVTLITEARNRLVPVSLGVGSGLTDGAWTNRNDPSGPVDRRVRVLTVRDAADHLLGAVLLFSCHPTVLPASNLRISADLAGGIRRAVAAELGPDPVLLTLTGAAGDTSTRHTRQGTLPAELDRLGRIAAQAALDGIGHTTPVTPGISDAVEHVTLPPLSTHGINLQEDVALADAHLRDLEARNAPVAEIRTAITRAQGALLRSRLADLPPTVMPIAAWRLGDRFSIVSMPGELFASLGAQIEAASPMPETWVVGYANGYVGYLPERAAYAAGTYEALASPFGDDAGDVVVQGAINALRRLIRDDQ